MKILLTSLTTLLFIFLGTDFVFNPQFTIKYFHLSSRLLLIIYFTICLILYYANKINYPKIYQQINKKIIFPIFLLINVCLIFLEYFNYQNYTLTVFRVHYRSFIFLTILSGFIIYINKNFSNPLNKFKYILGPSIVLLFIYLNLHKEHLQIIREDGLVETAQIFIYILSSVYAFNISHIFKGKNKINFYTFKLLGFLLFFVALEEMSWGQRLIGVDTPSFISEINSQGEITVHNLHLFQSKLHLIYMIVGFYGSILPMLLKKHKQGLYNKLSLFFPKPHLFFYYFAILFFYFLLEYQVYYLQIISGYFMDISRWQEVAELILSLGFLFYSTETYLQSKKYK